MTFTLFSSTVETDGVNNVFLGDLNADDSIDWIAHNFLGGAGSHNVYLNNGSASFTLSNIGNALQSTEGTVGDIDNDGDLDFLYLISFKTELEKCLNNGSGVFTCSTIFPVIDNTNDLRLADIDGDGDLDLLRGDEISSSTDFVYLNDGHGAFSAAASTMLAMKQHTLQVADYNSDGSLDVAFQDTSSLLHVYLNSGTGAFVQSYVGGVAYASGIVSGDLDGDGDIDIAVTKLADNNLTVLLNNGAGSSFTAGTPVATGVGTVYTIATGDVDNDGNLDLIIGGLAGSNIFLNDGSGVFTVSGSPAEVGDAVTSIGIADLDADGDLDYVRGAQSGGPRRVYKNDQAATLANSAPTAPTTLTGAKISDNGSTATIRLSWGSGSDIETSTRLLQYQLKLGTGSDTNNYVSAVTSSPNWVNRLMPNGQSKTQLIKNLPCQTGLTYYWSVSAIDTGFKSTASTEQTFTLDSSCTFTGSGGGGGTTGGSTGGASGGGGVPIHFFQHWRPPAGGAPADGTLTVTAFKDINADGKKQEREPTGFRGLSVTASGSSAEGLAQRKTLALNKDGTATFSLPPSDPRGYFILFDTDSPTLAGFTLTNKPSASGTVLRSEDIINIDLGFKRSNLLRYAPCLTIAATGETKSSEAYTFLSRLYDPFGTYIMQGISFDNELVSREEYFGLLRTTQCVTLESNETTLKEKIRLKKTSPLIDLPFNMRQAPSVLAYTLLTEGISLARITLKGPAADFSSRVTRREAIRTVFEALDVPSEFMSDEGILPDDLSPDDPLVPAFLTLESLGILPDSFLPILGPSQGISVDEATQLLARAALRGGRVFLMETIFDESSELKGAAPTITPTFLSELPPFTIPSCLEKYPDRPKDLAFVDVLPGDQNENDLREILSRGITNEKGKILWLLPATKRPTEFGVAKGSTRLSIDEIPTTLETLRDLLVLTCLPYDYNDPDSGDSRISRDNISNLVRDTSFASRVFYRTQDSIRLFNLSLFSYAQNILRLPTRSPADPLSVGEASSILSSALLHIAVTQESITPQEAENLAEPLTNAIAQELLGTHVDWRSEAILKNTPFTREMLISFLATVLQNRTSLSSSVTPSTVSLGDLWWERVQ